MSIYSDLLTLTNENDAFFFTDHVLEGITYRIFNYRLASYTDFCQKNALECRGSMFIMTDKSGEALITPVIVSRPMEKFFNLFENPFTMDLQLKKLDSIQIKEDGSLISTFLHCSGLRVKSKGSLASDQANDAMDFLDKRGNCQFRDQLHNIAQHGYTVNMEWCAPHNRIVLGYSQPKLIVLNVRDNHTGQYLSLKSVLRFGWDLVVERWVELYNIELSQYETEEDFIEAIPDMVDIEGFIIKTDSNQFVKIKTNWYLTQHRAKNDIDSPKRLFEVALYESTDDLRSLFTDNQYILDRISEMEQFVGNLYHKIVNDVESFTTQYQYLITDDNRKQYAIIAKMTLPSYLMPLVMIKYDQLSTSPDKLIDYKQFMMKNIKLWNIK